VLSSISQADAQRVRDFLRQSEYSEETLRKRQLTDLPSRRLRNQARLMDATREPSTLNSLLRWFWIGASQPASAVREFIPSWFTDLALSCGLLQQEGEFLVPEVMVFPVEGFLVVADLTSRMEASDAAIVLWPNPTSRLLSRFTVRRPSRATLDLGTGTGIQSLVAASHSEQVVGTDLNERAIRFAKFTAALNGLENIEFLTGDGYEPVAGRKFDLIVSNPPFFITPTDQYLFCNNPMDLDQMCRNFVRQAPNYLNEGGYFQCLCEWAELKDQPWQERVSEWMENSGCDAWILKGNTEDAAEYAQHRIADTSHSPEQDAELFASYMAYYRERKVVAIHDGIIAMRRRSGQNWILIEETSVAPAEPFGDSVLRTFEARDFLQNSGSDEQILAVKPRLSPHCRLEQVFKPSDQGWQSATVNLRLAKGIPFSVGLQGLVAEFLGGCTGTRSVGDLIQALAREATAPVEQVRAECIAIVRRLIERGFLLA
jgi:cyclopropane fatty-acyl-phospholipid synthase-like methyltransferase